MTRAWVLERSHIQDRGWANRNEAHGRRGFKERGFCVTMEGYLATNKSFRTAQ